MSNSRREAAWKAADEAFRESWPFDSSGMGTATALPAALRAYEAAADVQSQEHINQLRSALSWALSIIELDEQRIKELDPDGYARLDHKALQTAKDKAYAALNGENPYDPQYKLVGGGAIDDTD